MTTYTCRGAVASGNGGPLEIVDIRVPAPAGDQVLITVRACGLCHSDLHFIDGTSGTAFPYIVGHEISGVVREVGPDVRSVRVGDEVIVALIVPCGHCADCARDQPLRCLSKKPDVPRPQLLNGTALTPVLGVGGLAELVLTDELHVSPRPDGIDGVLGALLGCGVPTGYGAAVHTGSVSPGDRVAVIGAGGVGLAAISAARACGAREVVAFDLIDAKLAEARIFGATAVATAAGQDPALEPDSFDVVIDAVGGAATLTVALRLVRLGGRVVIAGAPRQDESVEISLRPFFRKHVELMVSHWGDVSPDTDLPAIVALMKDGGFPLDRYHTESVGLEQAAEALERLRRGEVLRSIVVMDPADIARHPARASAGALSGG